LAAELTSRFADAMAYAIEMHSGQTRKGTDTPYVAHLMSVAALALEHGATEDEAIAALLHDAIEDQGGAPTRNEIVRRFGPLVARIVEGCTDADSVPKPPWRARKEKFLSGLAAASPSVQLVCAADKLHNVRSLVEDYQSIGDELWHRFSGGKQGTLWYYRAVADALAENRTNPLVAKLRLAVAELEQLVAKAEIKMA
jgi:(p)ppGpp synthase/HD superfamily hydrolase